MNKLFISVILLIISSLPVSAQFFDIFDNVAVGGGLVTNRLTGLPFSFDETENRNMWSMNDYQQNHPSVGGSFNVMEPGIGIIATFTLNEKETMFLPVGLDYFFFESKERLPITGFITYKLANEVNILSPYIGFNYAFLRLPLASAQIYAGAELRGSYLHAINFVIREEWKLQPSNNKRVDEQNKENAFRLGGGLKIGVQGNLFEPFEINTSIGYNVMNLLFRDDERKELMTPRKNFENQESLTGSILFTFLVQYRF